jgi:hypothetical protein
MSVTREFVGHLVHFLLVWAVFPFSFLSGFFGRFRTGHVGLIISCPPTFGFFVPFISKMLDERGVDVFALSITGQS